MNVKIYTPLKNLPYIFGDENRPNWYDAIKKIDTFEMWDKEYFSATAIENQAVSLKSFDTAIWKYNLGSGDHTTRMPLRQMGNVKILIPEEDTPRYYFITKIDDVAGDDSVIFELSLDYWATFWNTLEFDGYAKIMRRHSSRYLKDGYVNIGLDSPVWNIDPAISHMKPTIIQDTYCVGTKTLDTKTSGSDYTANMGFALKGADDEVATYADNNMFVYALVSPLDGVANTATSSTYTTSEDANYVPQPMFIAPITMALTSSISQQTTDNTYSTCIQAGNNAIVKIIVLDYPLMDSTAWADLKLLEGIVRAKPGGGSGNPTQPFLLWGVQLDSIDNNVLRQIAKKEFKETLDLSLIAVPRYPDTPAITDDYVGFNELKLYSKEHYDMELVLGGYKKQIDVFKLGKKCLSDLGIILYHVNAIDLTLNTKIILFDFSTTGGDDSGNIYSGMPNLEDAGLICDGDFSIGIASNSATNYFQSHLSSFQTSKWQVNAGADFKNKMALYQGSSAGLGVGAMIGAPVLGAGLGFLEGMFHAPKTAATIAQNEFNKKLGNKQLDSQVQDLDRTPETIKGASNRDIFSLLYLNVNPVEIYSPTAQSYPNVKLISKTLTDQQQLIVSNYFNMMGYIENTLLEMKKNIWVNRYRFNYLKINDFHTCIVKDNLPLQVIDWFDKVMDKGVRLWNYDGTMKMNDYSKENWEVDILGTQKS